MNSTEKQTTDSSVSNQLLRTNRYVGTMILVMDFMLILGYLVELAKGGRPASYIFTFIGIVLGTLLLSFSYYLLNKTSPYVKYAIISGFFIVYTFAHLTSSRQITFVYIFPVLVLFVLYFDMKFMIFASIVTVSINTLQIILDVMAGHSSSAETTEYTIQMFLILAFAYSICKATSLATQFNREKVAQVEKQQALQKDILDDVLNIAETVTKDADIMNVLMKELEEEITIIEKSVEDISFGNQTNTENIEQQTLMTENIQSSIEQTKQITEDIVKSAEKSMVAVEAGKESIISLKEHSSLINHTNLLVTDSMKDLIQNTKEVESITEKIFSISNQTNLLALNASIESARAGEAGKGFAVVADQIRILAEQTKSLTQNISSIMSTLNQNAIAAGNSVEDVVKATDKQTEIIDNTQSNFHDIEDKMNYLSDRIKKIDQSVSDLLVANNTIVESISKISAVSQEITANTIESSSLVHDNREKTAKAYNLTNEIMETSKQVNKYL